MLDELQTSYDSVLLTLLLGIVIGCVALVLLQIAAVWLWFRAQPLEERPQEATFSYAKNLKVMLASLPDQLPPASETCHFLNLILALLWREWRDTTQMKDYFLKKINMEFQEILLFKTAGKFIEQISVKDFFLGSSLPLIKDITLVHSSPAELISSEDGLEFAANISYDGGFLVVIEVLLLFGKRATIHIGVNAISGRVQLRFSRSPCTHWSFSFYEEPDLSLTIKSNVEGRSLWRLDRLFERFIRQAMRKKHTLPFYKVRYQPFFLQPEPQDGNNEVYVHNGSLTSGTLTVNIMDCTRLPNYNKKRPFYCTLETDCRPCSANFGGRGKWPVFEVRTVLNPNDYLGINLKPCYEVGDEEHKELVVVESIHPRSVLRSCDIEKGDILLSVNSLAVRNVSQASKLLTQCTGRLMLQIQRPSGLQLSAARELHTDSRSDKTSSGVQADNTSLSPEDGISDDDGEEFVCVFVKEIEDTDSNWKSLLPLGSNGARKRLSTAVGKPPHKESLPTPPKMKENPAPLIYNRKHNKITQPVNRGDCSSSIVGSSVLDGTDIGTSQGQGAVTGAAGGGSDHSADHHTLGSRTSVVYAMDNPSWNEEFTLNVEMQHRYLNLCVWCKTEDRLTKDVLLGHVSIPLIDLAVQCTSTTSGKLVKTYCLVAGERRNLVRRYMLRSMNSFNPANFTGDITLQFVYEPSLSDSFPSGLEQLPEMDDIKGIIETPSSEQGSQVLFRDTMKDHNFLAKRFYLPARCHYCQRRFWTRNLYKCEECSMLCHATCLKKAMLTTHCTKYGVRSRPNLFSHAVGETPRDSPGESVVIDQTGQSEAGSLSGAEMSNELFEGVTCPKVFHSTLAPAVDAAKKAGLEIYLAMDEVDRQSKLEQTVENLQAELNMEREVLMKYKDAFNSTKSVDLKDRLIHKMRKSEDRSWALKLLMVQFSSALERCREPEERSPPVAGNVPHKGP